MLTGRSPLRGPGSSASIPQDPQFGRQPDARLVEHAVECELQESEDVLRDGAATIKDEVGVLRGYLGAAHALTPEASLLEQFRYLVVVGVLPDATHGGQRQRL